MNKKVDIVVEICAQLAEHENLHETVYESAKGAGVIGISALLGGLFGGKTGLVIGGALGSAAGYFMASDFKSIPRIIREDLTDAQRKKLYRRVNSLFKGIALNDVGSVMSILTANVGLKNNVLSVLTDYLKSDMGLVM